MAGREWEPMNHQTHAHHANVVFGKGNAPFHYVILSRERPLVLNFNYFCHLRRFACMFLHVLSGWFD